MSACAALSLAEHTAAYITCKILLCLVPGNIIFMHNWLSSFSLVISILILFASHEKELVLSEPIVEEMGELQRQNSAERHPNQTGNIVASNEA